MIGPSTTIFLLAIILMRQLWTHDVKKKKKFPSSLVLIWFRKIDPRFW